MTINGNPATAGQTFGPISLNVGSSNVITIRVMAVNGVTKSYQVTVLRTGTTNLSGLSTSAGPIAPAFNPNTLAYTVATGFTTDQTTINASTVDSTASVTVNGQGPIQGGGTFGPFPVSVGQNNFSILVTSPTVASKTYTVTITRQPPSTNANLSNLTVSQGTLNPSFNPGIFGYTVNVGNSVTSINVTATVQDTAASLEINNQPATSGQPFTVNGLVVGANGINIVVIPQSGNPLLYTITVNRAAPASGNSNLGSLAVSPGTLQPSFNPNTNNYSVSVSNATTSVVVTATTQDTNATMTINGQGVQSGQAFTVSNLQVGNNTVTIRVTAPAGNAENYVVTVNRAAPPSSDATLSNLVVNPPGGTVPGFNPQSSGPYTVNEPFGVSNVTVSVTRSNSNAVVFIDGSQTTSLPISLAAGPSSRRVNILVIAQDTVTTKSYAVDINVAAPSSNANLSSLSVTPGGSCNVPSTTNCNISVSSTQSQVTIAATKAVATANMTGAVTAPPGTASGQSTPTLTGPGPFQFTITVTAQAGNSNTYTINITRMPSNNAGLQSLQLFAGMPPVTPPQLLTGFSPPGIPFPPAYAASAPSSAGGVTVIAMSIETNATMTINTTPVARGQAFFVQFLATNPTPISIVITPPSGAADAKTYRIDVTKTP
jgi:hypothetical protein